VTRPLSALYGGPWAPREDAAERYRYSLEPASLMRRLIVNIEIETADGNHRRVLVVDAGHRRRAQWKSRGIGQFLELVVLPIRNTL
jgi:hypothetical protein